MKYYIRRVVIAKIPVVIRINPSFCNIARFFSKFPHLNSTKNNFLHINIEKTARRNIKITSNQRKLIISGPDIDCLTNPFNLIGIIQATFRFIGTHSLSKNILLLHASAAFFNRKAFCFGDDGTSTAKTLSSVECALASGNYLADEFCFFDVNSRQVFGYNFVPIHIRPIVKKHLRRHHKIKLPPTKFNQSVAGYFNESKNLFRTTSRGKIGAFIFVHFCTGRSHLKKLTGKKKRDAIANLVLAHLLKLFYPELDNMQFLSTKDSVRKIKYKHPLLVLFAKKFLPEQTIGLLTQNIPAYKLYISEPCQLQEWFLKINT